MGSTSLLIHNFQSNILPRNRNVNPENEKNAVIPYIFPSIHRYTARRRDGDADGESGRRDSRVDGQAGQSNNRVPGKPRKRGRRDPYYPIPSTRAYAHMKNPGTLFRETKPSFSRLVSLWVNFRPCPGCPCRIPCRPTRSCPELKGSVFLRCHSLSKYFLHFS